MPSHSAPWRVGIALMAAFLVGGCANESPQAKSASPTQAIENAFCRSINDEATAAIPLALRRDKKEWARETLDSWPAEYEGQCSETQSLLTEIAAWEVPPKKALGARGVKPRPAPSEETPDYASAGCEERIAAIMDLGLDAQAERDNVDAIRIDCDMPPLQQDAFWQEAWRRHLEGSS